MIFEWIATNRIKIGLQLWAIVLPNHKKITKHIFCGVFEVAGQKSKKKCLNLVFSSFYTKKLKIMFSILIIKKHIPRGRRSPQWGSIMTFNRKKNSSKNEIFLYFP